MRAIALSLVVLLAAGCAEMHWSRPGVDPARVEEDLAQCRGEARLQAARVAPRSTGLAVLPTDPMGRPIAGPSRARTEDLALLEQDLTGACMRGKGYSLEKTVTQ